MTLPSGQVSFDRVVTALDEPLRAALDRSLTGYAEIVPQAALLLDATGSGIVWFEDGVPTHATHTGTGATGSDVLAELAATGPFSVRLVAVSPGDLPNRPASAALPPDAPAERLAGDETLAARTRERTGADHDESSDEGIDAVEAFLEDDEKIRAIRDHARAEAKRKADEWGFDELGD
ncbi:MAG: hypothetical protein ACOCS7_00995 [Halolamina sp.]